MKVKLTDLTKKQLKILAKEIGVKGSSYLSKQELAEDIEVKTGSYEINIFQKGKKYVFSKKKYKKCMKDEIKPVIPYRIGNVLDEADGKVIEKFGVIVGELSIGDDVYRVPPRFCKEI